MSKKIKINYLLNLMYQILSLFTPLIVTPYISRVIGVDGIGQYSYSYSIMRYFWLIACLGVTTFGIREIGKNKNDIQKRTKTFWEIFLFKLSVSIPVVLVYLFLSYFIFSHRTLYFIETLYLFSVMVSITWYFQGVEKYVGLTIKNSLIKIFSIVLIFILIKSPDDLWLYVLILAAGSLIGDLSLWLTMPIELGKVDFRTVKPFNRYNVSQILFLFIPTISAQIFSILDKSLIGWITASDYENGVYEQAFKIINMGLTVITSLSLVKVPSVARAISVGNQDAVRKSIQNSIVFVFFLGVPIALGISAVAVLFVPIFMGAGYSEVVTLLYYLAPLILLSSFHQAIGYQFMIPSNDQNRYSLFLILSGLVNLVISIPLIFFLKAKGAAIGSICGEFLACVMCYIHIKRRSIFNIKESFYSIAKYFIGGLIMFSVVFCFVVFADLSDYVKLITAIFLGVFSYFLSLVIMRDEIMITVISKIFKRRKKL